MVDNVCGTKFDQREQMIWRFVIGAVELGVESPLESGDRNLFLLFFIVAEHTNTKSII